MCLVCDIRSATQLLVFVLFYLKGENNVYLSLLSPKCLPKSYVPLPFPPPQIPQSGIILKISLFILAKARTEIQNQSCLNSKTHDAYDTDIFFVKPL